MEIWKYELKKYCEIEMPINAQILAVQNQREVPCIWALVNPDDERELRRFEIVGTGHKFNYSVEHKYRGTFQLNGGLFVFHVFEIL
jgi:hypothetical protein